MQKKIRISKKLLNIVLFAILAYAIGLTADIAVTYYHYNLLGEEFYVREANKHLVAELREGFDFFDTNHIKYIILIFISISMMIAFAFFIHIHHPLYFSIGVLILLIIISLYMAYIHTEAAFSWRILY